MELGAGIKRTALEGRIERKIHMSHWTAHRQEVGGHSKCENAGLNLEARREGKWRPLFILLASLAGILIVFICGLAMYL